MKMKAAVLHAIKTPLEIEELEIGPVTDEDVLVKVAACGVCHTDLGGYTGQISRPLPLVMGHEAAGIVAEVGKGVTSVKPGDHVIISMMPYCGQCADCRAGYTYRCQNKRGPWGYPWDGKVRLHLNGKPVYQLSSLAAFAEHAVIHHTAAIKIPDDIPLEKACLIGCGVSTGMGAVINTARVRAGSTTLVIGCGGVGLTTIQACQISGAGRIIAADLSDKKLEEAKRFGATDVIDGKNGKIVDQVMKLTNGRGVDYSFEAVGKIQTMSDAFDSLARGGVAVMLGTEPEPDATIPISPPKLRMERTITGSAGGYIRPWRDFPLFLDYYKQGRLNLDGLITGYGRLEDINKALMALEKGEVIRTVLRMH